MRVETLVHHLNWNSVLAIEFAGNAISDWLVALAWLLAVPILQHLFHSYVLTWLRVWSGRTKVHWDQGLVEAMGGLRTSLLLLVALYPVVEDLVLPHRISRAGEILATIAFFLQFALSTSRFMDVLIQRTRNRALEQDPETATGLAAMSFIARLVLWTFLFLALLENLGFNVRTLLAGLGVGGIAVGLAMQNILGDLFSSLSIVLDKPFQIGHFVSIDGLSGTVENIGLKTTRIRSLSGELLIFSNTDLTKARLRNFRFLEERRIVLNLGLTYDTSAEKMEQVPAMVRSIIGAQPHIRFERAHFKEFADSSLNVEVVYWVTTPDYLTHMDIQQAINLAILRRFNEEGIGFAFPTRTVQLSGAQALPVRLQRRSEV